MNPKVHYQIHKILSLVPVLSWMNPVHIVKSCFFEMQFNITSHIPLFLLIGLFRSGFQTKICMKI
jgi:hypothetical protein